MSAMSNPNPFECAICFNNYNDEENIPVSFPCGHSCCISHVSQLNGNCHVCRSNIPNISNLSPNYALRDGALQMSNPNNINNTGAPDIPNFDNGTAHRLVLPPLNLEVRQCENLNDDNFHNVLLTVNSPDMTIDERIPSDIVLVVDTSGSMGSDASIQGAESSGLSMLDIVKHAVKTVIKTLGSKDRLALVSYSNHASVAFELMTMTEENKIIANDLLDSLHHDGMTNLWDGLFNGLELLKKRTSNIITNAAVFLLTDGEPNIEPPRGHISMLQRYAENNGGKLPGSVNTFGFGYSLDSKLLRNLALEGGGMYSFIPDSGFVGTAFVNSLSNILATVTPFMNITLEPQPGVSLPADCVCVSTLPHIKTSWGLSIPLGSIQAGQSVDIILKVTAPREFDLSQPLVYASMAYRPSGSSKTNGEIKKDGHFTSNINVNDKQNIQSHRLRSCVINTLDESVILMKKNINSSGIAMDKVNVLIYEFRSWLSNNNQESVGSRSPYSRINTLLEDLTGQVTQALGNKEYFLKWGRHYLPALQRAHELQQCNNFKDPGIQNYGGELFGLIRDESDDIFCKLPPPTSNRAVCRPMSSGGQRVGGRGGGGVAPVRSAPIDMSQYNCRSSGCFHSDSNVLMQDGITTKLCRDIKKGDVVFGGDSVKCIMRSQCKNSTIKLIHIDVSKNDNKKSLRLTPWHPVLINDVWQFPLDVTSYPVSLQETQCEAIYSFLLKKRGKEVIIDGIKCITMGHGIENDSVATHPFFGTEEVVKCLEKCKGWQDGIVSFDLTKGDSVINDDISGLVKSFNLNHEI
jgi:uncharacterized protein YegL